MSTPPVIPNDSTNSAASRSNFEWPTDSASYTLLGKIGRGAFATVYKAVPQNFPAQECAIKVLNLDHVDSDLQEIRREVQAMRLSSHANILTCYTSFVHDIHLWLVTTLMRKGSSLHCLQTARKTCPPNQKMEPYLFFILQQSLQGLLYIHDNQQIHRDMKGGNILLDSTGHVKIADFGVSQWLQNYGTSGTGVATRARTFVGTPCWMAPEVMEQHADGYDTKADIWSLGITALELAKGYAPYSKYPPMKVLILTIQEDAPNLDTYLTLDEDVLQDDDDFMSAKNNSSSNSGNKRSSVITEEYSKQFSDFVDKCLQKNPSRRPTCVDLLQHSALRQLTNDEQYLEQCRQELVTHVCNHVPDVGASVVAANDQGTPAVEHQQVKILFEQAEQRAKGTTWVFSDGSQVLSSTAMNAAQNMSIDDVMDELDGFGGGDMYSKNEQQEQYQHNQHQQDSEDMDAFLSDLEQTLPGEDYQRNPSSIP
mmetsp:Transcript_1308/g.1756  ORF Transcript_1308/g.1756 Transcript_1308/m.1756 type:complete len:481 (-) Transcript_1308:385-1827(-)